MTRIENTIVVDRPIDDIWPFFTELDNVRNWYPGARRVERPSPETFTKGATITISGGSGPLRIGSGLIRLEFDPVGATTRLTMTSDSRGVLGSIADLVGSGRKKTDEPLLRDLKSLIEALIPLPARRRLETPPPDTAAATAVMPAVPLEPTVAETEPTRSDVHTEAAISNGPAPTPMATNGSVEDDRAAAPATAGGQLVLQLESEGGPATTFEVPRSGATLGRGEENSIRLNDLSVSRRHARISYRQGGYWISDLGSTSGTWVDGTRLNAAGRLAAGQIIDVGVCRLSVALEADATSRQTDGAARRSAVSARRRR